MNARRVIGIGAEDSGGSGANASMDPCQDRADEARERYNPALAGPDDDALDRAEDLGGRIVNCFTNCETDHGGTLRGRRQIMLDDSDVHHHRHAKAAVGAVVAASIGDPGRLRLGRGDAPGAARRRAGHRDRRRRGVGGASVIWTGSGAPIRGGIEMDELAQFKAGQRQAWASFTPFELITATTAPQLVGFAGVRADQRLLDVGCGTGVVALTARRRGQG